MKNQIENNINEFIYVKKWMDQLPFGIMIVNRIGEIVYCSKTFNKMFNVDKTILNKNINKYFPQFKVDELLSNRETNEDSKIIAHLNGNRILTRRIKLTDDKSSTQKIVIVCELFSESVRTVERLIEVEDLKKVLKNLIGSANTAYYVTNEKGVCEYVNDAFISLFSKTKLELINERFKKIDFLHRKAIKTRRAIFNESIRIEKNKEIKTITGQVAPLLINGKLKGTIGLYYDETPIYELKKELNMHKQLIRQLENTENFSDIVTKNQSMKFVLKQARAIAEMDIPSIISGEIGTGKKLLARAIHYESKRRSLPLHYFPCHIMNEEEIEEKLLKGKNSILSNAKGTLILDELTEMSFDLQEKIIKRLNANDENNIRNLQIIAITTKDLPTLVLNRSFNKEFYTYLNKMSISLPPLQERKEDITLLALHFIDYFNYKIKRNIKQIDDNLLDQLVNKKWEFNIVELKNHIEKLMIYSPIEADILQEKTCKKQGSTNSSISLYEESIEEPSLQKQLDYFEKKIIQKVYKKNKYNKTKTAKQLKISLRSLYYKLDKFGID